ncbi:Glutamate receptor ionotropic, delta-1 [Folsomia candida]|uniref:Glutamate receptor ionotropic, delta-1 n=1 Tax=Folsomia candida TaxID=158441 RepID=A0A226DAJ0_FOLCA|nr:Glutamate receptor ionotropic, delta-1 [Folsomia candida]
MFSTNLKTVSLEDDLTLLSEHLQSPDSILENPNYIIFYVSKGLNKHSLPPEFNAFLKKLPILTITSKFLVVHNTSIFLVNLKDSSLFHITNHQSITSTWNQIHSNFNHGPVSVPKLRTSYEYFGIIYGKAVVCELGFKYSSSGQYCFIHSISIILNFTAYDYVFQKSQVPSGPPIAEIKKDGHQILLTQLNNPKDRLQVVPHFYNVLPFGFVLVIDRSEFEIANPISSFDIFTWILLFTSIVVVSIFLWVENEIVKKRLDPTNIPFLAVSCTLLEQSLSPSLWKTVKQDCTSSFKASRFILLIWFLISIVLIGGYRSVFYRFLTSSIPPIGLPSNLEQLIDSKYTMVGTDSFLLSMNGPSVNILEYIIGSYLSFAEENNEDDEGDVKHHNVREVQRTARFSKGLQNIIFLNKIHYSKLLVLHNYSLLVPNCCSKKAGVVLPKSFAMVSSTDGTSLFLNLMKMEEDKYFLIRSKEFDYFLSTTELFAVTSNFFAEPFLRVQSLLIQSGLFQIWTTYGKEMMLSLSKHFTSCLQNIYLNDKTRSTFWEYTAYLRVAQGVDKIPKGLQDYLQGRVVPKIFKIFRALSLKVVSMIFFSWAIGLILAASVFCVGR